MFDTSKLGRTLIVAVAAATFSAAAAPAQAQSTPSSGYCPADAPAVVIDHPAVEMPGLAQAAGQSGKVILQVTLTASGELQDAYIRQSSGSIYLDREALKVARSSKFSPETAHCTTIDGTYLYEVDFNA